MNHKSEQNVSPTLPAEQAPGSTLDAFLFKDNLWELIQALMEEGDWVLPADMDERLFVDTVFEQMRGSVRDWVRRAAHYFLENSEYFLSNQEALSIFDEEMAQRGVKVSDNVRQAFLEFLYRDFPNFCSQAISTALEDATAKKH